MDATLAKSGFNSSRQSISRAEKLEFKKTRLIYWNSKRRF